MKDFKAKLEKKIEAQRLGMLPLPVGFSFMQTACQESE